MNEIAKFDVDLRLVDSACLRACRGFVFRFYLLPGRMSFQITLSTNQPPDLPNLFFLRQPDKHGI
jgi:hypothetical protein